MRLRASHNARKVQESFNFSLKKPFGKVRALQKTLFCPGPAMRVLKFGGSTMRSPADCRQVAQVVRRAARRGPVVVVVSALYGVTNRLVELVHKAAHHHMAACRHEIAKLRTLHEQVVRACVPRGRQAACRRVIADRMRELEALCVGISQVHECSPRTRDRLIGYGELLSAPLIAAIVGGAGLRAVAVDARALIVTDDNFGEAHVDMKATRACVRAAVRQWRGTVPVVTGFVAATSDGVPTTVGRNGSDYTAALFGALLKAKEIEIWTDVDGVLSADPALVRDAFPLPHLTYAEAMELAYFGAKVLHPQTVIPAVDAKVPLRILNLYHPDFPGTVISAREISTNGAVKGITAIPDMSLVSLEGAGMVGVTGVAGRMFGALAQADVNVTLISQASSEQSICCVVQRKDAAPAQQVLREAFAQEFRRRQIRRVAVRNDIAVIAAVGSRMRGTPGIAARLFGALGKNRINVVAVAQGSSEQNISVVIADADRAKALNALHGALHLSPRNVHLMVIGKGTIATKLLDQIAEGQDRLERELNIRLRVVGIADRNHCLRRPEGIRLARWRGELARAPACAPERIGAWMQESRLENPILVDATASERVARLYPQWLGAGISVVTPNKKANTLSQPFYDQLQVLTRQRRAYYLYETCVGAGLPVISTLQDLIHSGDRIISIEAALSGTLGFVFGALERGQSFSEAIGAAHRLGYTEPDPREDLSGQDVARKLLILARKAGMRLNLAQVRVEPLLPKGLRHGGTVPAFLRRVQAVDAAYAKRVAAATQAGKVLRYIGRMDGRACRVSLQAVDRQSPFGTLHGGDNLVVFTTARYRTHPLIVRGPGAGPDVTAGGVFADILKVAHLLTTM